MHREKGNPDNHVLYRTQDDEDFAIIVARRRRTARKHLKGTRGDGRRRGVLQRLFLRRREHPSATFITVLRSNFVFAVVEFLSFFLSLEDSDENE